MLAIPLRIFIGISLFLIGVSFIPWPDIAPQVLSTIHQMFQWLWFFNQYVAVDELLKRAWDLIIIEWAFVIIKLIQSLPTGRVKLPVK